MKLKVILFTGLMLVLGMFFLHSKRLPPPEVKPIEHDNIEYSAPTDMIGCIRAVEKKSGTNIWWKQIYIIKYNPNLERDVQDVYIKGLEIKNDKLLIENEKGYLYELNIKNLKLKTLKGKKILEWNE